MKKYTILLISLALLINPQVSGAQSDIDSSSDASCAVLSTNLRYGMKDSYANGNSVSILQDFLNSRGYLKVQPTGFFGSLTRTAVASFQRDNGISAIPPGFVGPITRARIQTLDCNGVVIIPPVPIYPYPYPTPPPNNPVVISGVSGPQSLGINQQGTWTVSASDGSGGNLSYSVDWGDQLFLGISGTARPSSPQQSASFTHTYSEAGKYTLTFTVTNTSGQSAQTYLTVEVGGGTTVPNILVTSPNGGEVWVKGTTYPIQWRDNIVCPAGYVCEPPNRRFDIKLNSVCSGEVCTQRYIQPYTIALNVSSHFYNWTIPPIPGNCPAGYACILGFEELIPDGTYTVEVCQTGTNMCDSSDRYFRIIGFVTTAL